MVIAGRVRADRHHFLSILPNSSAYGNESFLEK